VDGTLTAFDIVDSAIIIDHRLLVDRKARAQYAGGFLDVTVILDSLKTGVTVPLHDTGVGSGSTDSMTMEEEGEPDPGSFTGMTMLSPTMLLKELAAWLDIHLYGALRAVSWWKIFRIALSMATALHLSGSVMLSSTETASRIDLSLP